MNILIGLKDYFGMMEKECMPICTHTHYLTVLFEISMSYNEPMVTQYYRHPVMTTQSLELAGSPQLSIVIGELIESMKEES